MANAHDLLFRTLADPTRRALFERLCREGEKTVGALTARAGISQPAVSKHLGVLKQAGLVRDRQQGRQSHYSARLGALAPLIDWTIRIGERTVNELSPKNRDIAMVFQSYALYPHLSVGDNIGFALKITRRPSGVHSGACFPLASTVRRVSVAPARSHSQMAGFWQSRFDHLEDLLKRMDQ